MRRSDFHYELPDELIAQGPPAVRSAGRMLCLDARTGRLDDRAVADLPVLLRRGDLLVFNNTRVFPARLRGNHATGGRFEILIERLLGAERALAQIRSGRPLRRGDRLAVNGSAVAEIVDRHDRFHELRFEAGLPLADILNAIGEVPLPPYIKRPADAADRERYQTVFASRDGAVAAPTAGLHFDRPLLDRLAASGIEFAEVTLHIGAGTFQPVRTEDIAAHVMHKEWVDVGVDVCRRIAGTRARGGRVVAVGTTVARALETAAHRGTLEPFNGETALFITPGYRFRSIDALLTNFHMPSSTLLMLVCAFAGTDATLVAYRHAVRERYRFFSYGDAMLIQR